MLHAAWAQDTLSKAYGAVACLLQSTRVVRLTHAAVLTAAAAAAAAQDAESGTIEMKLEWQNCFVDQYVD
jgi:hypothetical protein